jgi:hypothetical protein
MLGQRFRRDKPNHYATLSLYSVPSLIQEATLDDGGTHATQSTIDQQESKFSYSCSMLGNT